MKNSKPLVEEHVKKKKGDKRRARKEATHLAIQEAAERLALNQGQLSITTKALVREANVSERTIFNHFSSIDEILLSCLSHRLSSLVQPQTFPTVQDKKDLPQAVENFVLDILEDETTDEPLGQFVLLAKTFQTVDEISDAVGQDVFKTLLDMGWDLTLTVEEKHPELTIEEQFQLVLYIHNLMNSLAYGMGRYLYLNHERLDQDIDSYSLADIRQSMVWAVKTVSAGKPDFS